MARKPTPTGKTTRQKAKPTGSTKRGRTSASRGRGGKSSKYVYSFGSGQAEGNAGLRNLLGGKGANLAEMAGLGLPVPPGFTISTEICTYYYDHERSYPSTLDDDVRRHLRRIEKAMDRRFGDAERPLLVSVRSGARTSMPGMMDTILNLGLNDETVDGLVRQSGSERFAYDSYRRFVQMYGDVVLGLKPESAHDEDPFEQLIERKKRARGVKNDVELDANDLRELVGEFKELIRTRCGVDFPEDPLEQLWGAIGAVFGSWHNERAIVYRRLNHIPDEWGTAVNVQSMVFGNLGDDSATGVAFTRDPASGEKLLYGEFLVNAQGEDVVAGTRTPQQLTRLGSERWAQSNDIAEEVRAGRFPSLEERMPKAYKELVKIARTLEKHYRNMQDLEFTIEQGRLFMLQCRNGKRTGAAAIRIAVDFVKERLLSSDEALHLVEPDQLNQLLQPVFEGDSKTEAIEEGGYLARGLNAGPGAATGQVVFDADEAEARAQKGQPVILTRIETSPEDIRGMSLSKGILTARGGMTSHAALVARQMGKVCVCGCEELHIDYGKRQMQVAGRTIREGDWISIDGTTGEIFLGQIRTRPSEVVQVLLEKSLAPEKSEAYQRFSALMKWADKARRLGVRANADLPKQAETAIAFGAQGIGLCRTEHMFFEGDRITLVREMILAEDDATRDRALDRLRPLQRDDFVGIFQAMQGRPVTVRLLDPPLHEFLPHSRAEIEELAKIIGASADRLAEKCEELRETNPMLGHRGCRLGITFPTIYRMQTRAIIEAACQLARDRQKVHPEIMIPLVGVARELRMLRREVEEVAAATMKEQGVKVRYTVGTMIEVPRAALTADAVAEVADFFSFGTNDLTQMTYGISRDDIGKFLPAYLERKVFEQDPFAVLDPDGVGALVEMAARKGRAARPDLKLGICGEHGGEPSSVTFCHDVGLDYVSCSPFRLPIARLAAAQAATRR